MLSPRLILALVAGAAAGALTQWLVLRVPESLVPLTNAAAPWVLVAFVVALTARRTGEALVLAVVTFLALVLGFYVAQATRGWEVSHHQVVFWSLASFVAGPLVGLAADWVRHRGSVLAGLGAGIVGGILVGEAVQGLRKEYVFYPTFWRVQLGVGVALAIALTLWRCRHRLLAAAPAFVAAAGSTVVIGLATLVAYRAQ